MAAKRSRHWLSRLLTRLPAGWVARLDAWSARVALRRAEQRRQAALLRMQRQSRT